MDSKKLFEDWARPRFHDLSKSDNGDYIDDDTIELYSCWTERERQLVSFISKPDVKVICEILTDMKKYNIANPSIRKLITDIKDISLIYGK